MSPRWVASRGLAVTAVFAALAATPVATLLAAASDPVTTYAAVRPAHLAATPAAGLALGIAGALLLLWPPGRALAWLALACAVAWSAPEWTGWETGPDLPRSVGELVPRAAVVVLAGVLALRYPGAPAGRSFDRAWLWGAAGLLAALWLSRALVRDPFLAADCWRNCSANVFLLRSDAALAADVGRAGQAATAVVGLGLVLIAAPRIRRSWRRRSRAPGLTLVAACLFALLVAAQAVVALLVTPEHPDHLVHEALSGASALAASAFAAALCIGPLGARRARRRARRLADAIADASAPTAAIAERLRADLRDPTLQIAFPLPEGGWVDDHGGPVEAPRERAGRALVRVERRGRLVAALEHDPAVPGPTLLAEMLRPAARIALDNGRLQAVSRAQMHSLAALRRRVVQDGDRARRRLERDLHDGAQQALIGLLINLRVTRADARDDAAAQRLDAAIAELKSAIGELRTIARGIHPAALQEGVASAVEELLDDVAVPVVSELAEDRFPAELEFAIYRLFARVLDSTAERMHIRLGREGRKIVAEADLLGDHAPDLDDLADRFAALDGALTLRRNGVGSQVRGILPL